MIVGFSISLIRLRAHVSPSLSYLNLRYRTSRASRLGLCPMLRILSEAHRLLRVLDLPVHVVRTEVRLARSVQSVQMIFAELDLDAHLLEDVEDVTPEHASCVQCFVVLGLVGIETELDRVVSDDPLAQLIGRFAELQRDPESTRSRESLIQSIRVVGRRHGDHVVLLRPIEDVQQDADELLLAVVRVNVITTRRQSIEVLSDHHVGTDLVEPAVQTDERRLRSTLETED